MIEHAKPGEPEIWREGVETRVFASALNGARALCMFEQWVAPGTGAPNHSHPVEEVLSVRDGLAEAWVGERRVRLAAGESLVVPARANHGFTNVGTGTLHIQAVLASDHFEATYDDGRAVTRWVK